MRAALVACLALTGACASARATPVTDQVTCQFLGDIVLNPKHAVLDARETFGPSQVIFLHPGDPYLVRVGGELYRCERKS
jgi:hypothetical protein